MGKELRAGDGVGEDHNILDARRFDLVCEGNGHLLHRGAARKKKDIPL